MMEQKNSSLSSDHLDTSQIGGRSRLDSTVSFKSFWSLSDSNEPSPIRTSFLYRSSSPLFSRSSISTSRVMERLNIEKEDGGAGITIGKFYVANNCNIIVIIMAGIFLLVGAVLTAISYRPRDHEVEEKRLLDRHDWSWQTKIVGPSFMTIGFVMLLSGIALCLLGWKVSRPERDQEYVQTDIMISHVYQERKYNSESPVMTTIAQALPVSLMSTNLPAMVPVNILAMMNESSRQHLLKSSFDSATLAVDWISLRPKRSVSLPFHINDESVTYTVTNEQHLSNNGRRQSLPLFEVQESPKVRIRKRSRRKSSGRPSKVSDAKIAVENCWGRNPEFSGYLQNISSRYDYNPSVPMFVQPAYLRRDIACFPLSASETSLEQQDRPMATVAVSSANGGPEPQIFRFDPTLLPHTNQVGSDLLPRIEVTSPGRGTLGNSTDTFGFPSRSLIASFSLNKAFNEKESPSQ